MKRAHDLEAVIFDWAGTTVDHGCMSPLAPFLEVFRRRGVTLTADVARGPMGTHKRTHIERLCAVPEVAAAWRSVWGRSPTDVDVDAMFAEFVPLQLAVLRDFAEPIVGCTDVVDGLRAAGVRIGTTTGYTRAMLDLLAPEAARRGFSPDVIVAADDVAHARPWPDMCLRNAIELGVSSVGACVKVDDTPAGIAEGVAAGMWTVGVVMTGNELGCTPGELLEMSAAERAWRRHEGTAHLYAAGADVVIDGVYDLSRALERLGLRVGGRRAA
jgi:phosphonoacetaldehyde hydrolase